jgi:hypothetical protein
MMTNVHPILGINEMKSFHIDPDKNFSESRTQRLLVSLNQFAARLAECGYKVSAYSERALRKFEEIPVERQEQIIGDFENWNQWFSSVEGTVPFAELEKHCLRRALDNYGFHADEEFWKTLGEGQIVEIYGPEMIQYYRSFSFFKITGYSILDISVFECFMLWERPKKAIEETYNDVKVVLEGFVPVKRFQIPKQLIRETYQTGSTEPFQPRAILAEFLYMGSLRAKVSDGIPTGFICSSRAEVIALGDEALKIEFV